MSFNLSPNMLLPIPAVGSETGPNYAFDINSSLTLVDQHDHSPGKGVQITPAGLNINTSLTFNNNFPIDLAGLTLNPQLSPPAINTIYESGVDLFYVDGLGNNIRITESGGVAGSPGSISNLTSPASAAYVSVSQTFVWESGAGIAANMDFGSALLRNLSPNSTYALTLSPPALSSNYTITLPYLPSSQKIMTLDAAGNMSAPYTVDNSTLTIASNVIEVASGGITSTQLATNAVATSNIQNGAVTNAKLAALNYQVSPSSGSQSTTSSTFSTITNLSVSLTTSGRPIMVFFEGNAENPVGAQIGTTGSGVFLLIRDGTNISYNRVNGNFNAPPGSVVFLDTGATAGPHTYIAQFNATAGTTFIEHVNLVAYEVS